MGRLLDRVRSPEDLKGLSREALHQLAGEVRQRVLDVVSSRGGHLGAPLGVDVCYTNHAEADQDDMDSLLTLLAAAGVTFVMGVPGADDVMLNYQSTSFHDALYVRELLGRKRAPEFEAWLARLKITGDDGRLVPPRPGHPLLASA